MCLDSLAKAHKVYSKEVPLAQARDINGLRAVFGEVCSTVTMHLAPLPLPTPIPIPARSDGPCRARARTAPC